MPLITLASLLGLFLFSSPQSEIVMVHIPSSKAIRIAETIAGDEGYAIDGDTIYFDLLATSDGKPLLQGYTSVGFYINGNIRSAISISETTGQALDMNSCEIFDYPDLKAFQKEMLRLSKAKMKSPRELADDAGCGAPKVLNAPVAHVKRNSTRKPAERLF